MEIPLFPLPDLVLFPSVGIPLHIFEERYRLMINECISANDVFGVVMLSGDATEENEQTICPVGATARIVRVERLSDGRMNIVCRAESRFRILRFTQRFPYWKAIVESSEDEAEDDISDIAQKAASLYRRMLELSAVLSASESAELTFPDSPVEVSFILAYMLDIEPEQKQMLLEITSTTARLNTVTRHLELAIERLEKAIAQRDAAKRVRGNGSLLH